MNNIVIYHNNCSDGFAAAAVTKLHFKDQAEYFPGNYTDAPPSVVGKNVYFVDFSYSLEVVSKMLLTANHVYFIDHHKTAIEALAPIFNHPKFTPYVSLEKSGAGLTWDYFYPNKAVPDLIKYVEDRDLWNWKYSNTQEYLMAIELEPFNLETYSVVLEKSITESTVHTNFLINQGTIIKKYYDKCISQCVENSTIIKYKDMFVPICNCYYKFSSHVGNALAKANPYTFSIMYEIRGDVAHVSFRSVETGVDVSEIAKELGGGGHQMSSGVKIPTKEFFKLFLE
jgi:oligoribonuclease NrnB/cAMP/cGMP phosphodiesterase (DHH superfamily)